MTYYKLLGLNKAAVTYFNTIADICVGNDSGFGKISVLPTRIYTDAKQVTGYRTGVSAAFYIGSKGIFLAGVRRTMKSAVSCPFLTVGSIFTSRQAPNELNRLMVL